MDNQQYRRTVPIHPPLPVQVRDMWGQWRNGLLTAWHLDDLRGWIAEVTVYWPSEEVRPRQYGPGAGAPGGHPLHRRRRYPTGPGDPWPPRRWGQRP